MDERAASAEVYPSMALAEIVGQRCLSRVEILARLLRYIDAHHLRPTSDADRVRCDSKLRAAFGLASMTVAEMERRIGEHVLSDVNAAPQSHPDRLKNP